MIRNVHAVSLALAALLATTGALAASDKAQSHSQGAVHANPQAVGFTNPSSVLYDNVSQVPEPTTLGLAAAGVAVVLWARRRRGQ